MPLVTRQATQGNLYLQATEPPNWIDGDVWSNTTDDILELNVGGTATPIETNVAELVAYG